MSTTRVLKEATKREPRKIRNFLATDEEWDAIRDQAKKFANGNMSLWLRYAGRAVQPKAGDLA